MSFYKTSKTYKVNILNQIKHLVSKTLSRAVEILLSPCCGLTIKEISYVCNGSNYDITISLEDSISLVNKGVCYLKIGDKTFQTEWIDSSLKITFYNVIMIPGTYSTSLQLFLPTSTDENIGIVIYSNEVDFVLNTCP